MLLIDSVTIMRTQISHLEQCSTVHLTTARFVSLSIVPQLRRLPIDHLFVSSFCPLLLEVVSWRLTNKLRTYALSLEGRIQ